MRVEAIKIEADRPVSATGLTADDVEALVRSSDFTWIDIQITEKKDTAVGQLLVERLDFHPATVADCFHAGGFHQPKMDEEQDYRFITFIYYEGKSTGKLVARELHAYLGQKYVITVHRHNCEELLSLIRQFPRAIKEYEQRAMLFMHHILDMVIDSFAPIMHDYSRRGDELEMAVLKVPRRRRMGLPFVRRSKDEMADMRGILRLRRSLVRLRRTLIEEEEIVEQLIGEHAYEDAPESSEEIAIYFRDIADHIGKYLEIIEGLESAMNHLMEVHALITSHRTNEIVYVLTIISTIMLPLNLIVGFWGMNFGNLWFAGHAWGIWLITGLMLLVVIGLLFFFRHREWI